ncbi:hypothetical protein FA95DRAFT_1553815 [Auriscalpium vulgare]|uniref:Uncharacterized protein n=1 Tax=Auriscalpium vulgare TaxID=40419 RepID=A0ACB8S7F7_9AGAM|nr:hypothetical protein FA95DRAFT_1553815 [Auriscalpium vulgare]
MSSPALHPRSTRSLLSAIRKPPSIRAVRRPCHGPASYSTTATVARGSSFRVQTVFYILLGVGTGSTAYGLYSFYTSFTLWPSELRQDLRAGIKAKHQGDFALSERFLRRAYETALSLPKESLAPQPYLKLSGISVLLGEVLESNGRPKSAYEAYSECLAHLQSNWSALAGQEKMRAVAIAHKLGEMADTYQQGEEEEERWLTWAVEEVLRISKDASDSSQSADKMPGEDGKIVLAELELPKWVSTTDVGAPLEALGTFYAKVGKLDFAVPLYLQAISLLIPPTASRKVASPDDLCRGAQLMSNLSELFMRGASTAAKLHQAEAWARQALALIEKTKARSNSRSDELQICEQALAVTLFNLGAIREMSKDPTSARELFQRSWEQSSRIGLRDGTSEARQALRRLDRLQRAEQEASLPTTVDPKTKT